MCAIRDGMQHPVLYEINTRQWLADLSERLGRDIELGDVPDDEIQRLQQRGVTHVWLMGVWPTGPKSRNEAVGLEVLRSEYDKALPGWTDDDVLGSPYAVGMYSVSPLIGGDAALETLRNKLALRGIKLILDFVPNHMGLDHPWVTQKPHLFVGQHDKFTDSFKVGNRHIAFGKDPYFAGWTDTAQIDYRKKETRIAMIDTLRSIAQKCDGVRCDMAMLMLNDVFDKTWAHVPKEGQEATGEFWSEAIQTIRSGRKDFLFLAEAYWDLEGRLCDLGFDYAYDKKLYDFVVHDHAWDMAPHLYGLGPHNARRAHFLENHDEPRIASKVDIELHRAAALLMMALPGMRFLHDGQLEGRKTFARIQLSRRKPEDVDEEVKALYDKLLPAVAESAIGRGIPTLIQCKRAWEDNASAQCFTIIQWQHPGRDDRFDLAVINLASHRAQCWAQLTAHGLMGGQWQLQDRLGPERWIREGDDLAMSGLFLDVPPRAAQLFAFHRG
jgi:glycosidase